jgi:hypothetical protein
MSNSTHIDFSEVPDFAAIPAGRYDATIVSAQPGTSRAGLPKIDLRWKIEDGEYANRQVFDQMSFAPNALWRTKQSLQAIDSQTYGKDFRGEVEAEDLIGQHATLIVIQEQDEEPDEDTGEPKPPRNRVKSILPYGTTVQAAVAAAGGSSRRR